MNLIPLAIANEVGCTPNMLYKINRGLRQPSLQLAQKIIRAMAARGHNIRLVDLRPDLADVLQQ